MVKNRTITWLAQFCLNISSVTFAPKTYHLTHVWLPAWKDKMNSRNEKCLYLNVWTHFKFSCLLLFGFTRVWNQDNFQMFKTTFLWSWAVQLEIFQHVMMQVPHFSKCSFSIRPLVFCEWLNIKQMHMAGWKVRIWKQIKLVHSSLLLGVLPYWISQVSAAITAFQGASWLLKYLCIEPEPENIEGRH